MKTLSNPSDEFASAPPISLRIPDDWVNGPSAPALLTALGPDYGSGFRANVLVTAERLAEPVSAEQLASLVRARLADLPQIAFGDDQVVLVGGRSGRVVQYSYVHPEAGTIAQAVLSIPVRHNGVVDLFQVVGTAGADRIETDFAAVSQILLSFAAEG